MMEIPVMDLVPDGMVLLPYERFAALEDAEDEVKAERRWRRYAANLLKEFTHHQHCPECSKAARALLADQPKGGEVTQTEQRLRDAIDQEYERWCEGVPAVLGDVKLISFGDWLAPRLARAVEIGTHRALKPVSGNVIANVREEIITALADQPFTQDEEANQQEE